MAARSLPDFTVDALTVKPLERADTIPSSWYTDPTFHRVDREAIFARTWQGVGHVSQIAEPGQYLLATVAESPILVVRGEDGVIRGFFNVCRHRGGPLATCDGRARHNVFKCRYHGWTYRLDGRLRGVPAFDRVELFERSDYGLVPVRIDEWDGLLFATLDEQVQPVAHFVAGITERIAPEVMCGKHFVRQVAYDVACNWKVYVDNYLEGYHVPHVHPELCSLYDFRDYVTETHRDYSLQHSPFSGRDGAYDGTEGRAFYYCLFPGFMMNILPGRLQTNIVVPVSHDQCRIVFQYFYDGDVTSPEAAATIEQDVDFSERVQREDGEICALVQRGLNSPAYDRGRFSVQYESGVHHFHNLIREAYARWLAERENGREPAPRN